MCFCILPLFHLGNRLRHAEDFLPVDKRRRTELSKVIAVSGTPWTDNAKTCILRASNTTAAPANGFRLMNYRPNRTARVQPFIVSLRTITYFQPYKLIYFA